MTVDLNVRTVKALSKAEKQRLEQVISERIILRDTDMEKLTWKMTYDPEKTSEELGFMKANKRIQIIIRGEMVKNYRAVNPDWTYGRREKAETAEKSSLLQALKYDTFAYDTVMSHIRMRATFKKEDTQKVLRCLNSERVESQFGGIRSLGFRKEEANFLKNAAREMGRVLEKMLAEKT